MQKLTVVPITFAEACAFIRQHHRHHLPPRFHKFSLAIADAENVIRAVCVVNRPVAIALDDGWTLEVIRLASDGCRNACSCAYAAAWRAASSLGYKKLITYILDTEHGTSLTAAGWRVVGVCGGGTWNRKSRPRVDKHPLQKKIRWEITGGQK